MANPKKPHVAEAPRVEVQPSAGTEANAEQQEPQRRAWEVIEEVEDIVEDPAWHRDLFGGRSREQMEREGISPDLVECLVERLADGRYIGPLETQPVSWSDTKIYRDIVQNFFDGMANVEGRPTLDGVELAREEVEDEQGRRWAEFTLSSPAEYDHRYLLHHGGTTKYGDDRVVGEFGEGLKIASFLLTKQGVTDAIELGSDHWQAQYYLDELPPEEYPEPVRGLHLRAQFVGDGVEGNYLRFRVNNEDAEDVALILEEMQTFFWYEGHPDFENPTFENAFGGFRFLPQDQKGNLYVAGQRHEFGDNDEWTDVVPGAHIWTFEKVLEKTRDRNFATRSEVERNIIQLLVHAMKKGDLLQAFEEGEEYWFSGAKGDMGRVVMKKILNKLGSELAEEEKEELRSRLPKDIFVRSGKDEHSSYSEMLEKAGYRAVLPGFAEFGVPDERERIMSLVETAREPTLEEWEERRVAILSEAIELFVKEVGSNIIREYQRFLPDREGDLFDWNRLSVETVISAMRGGEVPTLKIRETDSLWLKKGAGKIELHGFTTLFPEHIFLQKKLLRQKFLGALFTWMHEFAHNISGDPDHSQWFYDAEQHLHELLMILSFEDDQLKTLQQWWDETSPEE